MDGISKITARIAGDAKRETDEILAAANKEGEEMARQFRTQAKALESELAQRNQAEAATLIERRIGVAHLEARKRLLAAKQDMIAKAFDEALTGLAQLPETELTELLGKLAAGASRSGQEKIVLSMQDHTRFGKKVAEKANALLKKEGREASLSLSESPRALPGGGLVLSDGDIEINASFASIIGTLRNDMSAEVAKIIFP